ncbi:MAG TPA: carbohydrate esterase, partial [Clostridiales bacterium UBA8960]|nr:carbohydrate esterase [Clostridiales bacterium UBA8960]
WDVQTSIEKIMVLHGYEGVIVVGVDNSPGLERLDEYSPWVSERADELKALGEFSRDIGGEGIAYGKFIVKTLKPLIDTKYRTIPDREHTAVAGSSMGGFISLYLGAEYPEVFSKVGAFSTAAWFADHALHEHMKKVNLTLPIRWYLDIGTNETSNEKIENFKDIYVDGTLALENQLIELGVPRDDVRVVVEAGAVHNELAWARRFPEAFKWLFNI